LLRGTQSGDPLLLMQTRKLMFFSLELVPWLHVLTSIGPKLGKNSPMILGLLMPWDLKLDDRLSWALQHSSLRIYPGALDGDLPWITGGRHGASKFFLICFCNAATERVSCRFAQGS
jgi:hypothetical protein